MESGECTIMQQEVISDLRNTSMDKNEAKTRNRRIEKQLKRDSLNLLTDAFENFHTYLDLMELHGKGQAKQLKIIKEGLETLYRSSRGLINRPGTCKKTVH